MNKALAEKCSISFLNFLGSVLKRPIYKGFRTCC